MEDIELIKEEKERKIKTGLSQSYISHQPAPTHSKHFSGSFVNNHSWNASIRFKGTHSINQQHFHSFAN